ncbi:MAG: hypothetical protein B7Y86_07705 [Brevundimonas subvibrioides]|uniref:Lipoprotein n=1 Tax=Brevundimonas subvibrioides TaxID=74313 RepID=A0A258HJ70_9CAUL|nr:hypothetical protein [Brevundimonas subvibrioides]OYX56657.1 MAG: hypothetical protein B7Y86_07705 [Brevundimonas subvibrioides]
MKTILTALALSLIVAAPAVAEVQPAPTPTVFEGWINFSGEEFQLIESENRYVAGTRRPCVSGALPRDEQRMAAATIGRQKVRVTGTAMEWSDDLPGDRYDYEGSNIRNECDGAFVILGTDIAVIQ